MANKERNLTVLLPHRAPMILLDQVLDYGDDFASAQLQIHTGSRFFDAQLQGVPAWVGIEYMAQTMGIWSGAQQLLRKKTVEIGFLLGTRRYQCSKPVFACGTRLQVECKVLFCGEDGIGAFECSVKGYQKNNDCIVNASARINAFLPDNSAEFLRRGL